MNDDHALLRAVLEDPSDLAARLVYADFLEEKGTPADICRAEFIRLQCSDADVRDRTSELIGACWRHWTAAIPGQVGEPVFGPSWAQPDVMLPLRGGFARFTYRRGFVEIAMLSPADILEQAAALFSREPVVEVYFYAKPPLRVDERYEWVEEEAGGSVAGAVPRVLFRRLLWGRLIDGTRRSYPSIDAAMSDLSQVCVAHGREAAGLPAWGKFDSLPVRPRSGRF